MVEILDAPEEDEEEDGAVQLDEGTQASGKCVVLKTSTRQTIFLPVVGLVDPLVLKPGDLVGVNKDSYLILDTLPAEYDSRVKAMEVDDEGGEAKPTSGSSTVVFSKFNSVPNTKMLTFYRKETFSLSASYDPSAKLPNGFPTPPELRSYTYANSYGHV